MTAIPAPLIDVHVHYIPDVYREALIAAGHERPDGMPGIPAWSEAATLAMMDELGIAAAILSISSPGVHFGDDGAARRLARAVNEEGARLRRAHPRRFGFFASLPLPDIEGALAEIAHAFDALDADGVVIESNTGGHYWGDPALDPILAELDRRGAVVLLHPTNAPGAVTPPPGALPAPILEFMFDTTRAVARLVLSGALERYRGIRLIVSQAGGALPALIDRIALAAAVLPNMGGATPASIMAALSRVHYDLAGAPVPRQLDALRSFVADDRLLYGSDWPFTPLPAVARLKAQLEGALIATPGTLDAERHRNPAALFPRFA